jgi:hypothetical protein
MTLRLNSARDAIAAGRLGLWLLGRRQHAAAQKRRAFPTRVRNGTSTLAARFAQLICPWRTYEYAGSRVILGAILGVNPQYAKNLMQAGYRSRLPPKHAQRLAGFLELHASKCDALARELRAYAQDRTLVKNG